MSANSLPENSTKGRRLGGSVNNGVHPARPQRSWLRTLLQMWEDMSGADRTARHFVCHYGLEAIHGVHVVLDVPPTGWTPSSPSSCSLGAGGAYPAARMRSRLVTLFVVALALLAARGRVRPLGRSPGPSTAGRGKGCSTTWSLEGFLLGHEYPPGTARPENLRDSHEHVMAF